MGCRSGITRRIQSSISAWSSDGTGGFRVDSPLRALSIARSFRVLTAEWRPRYWARLRPWPARRAAALRNWSGANEIDLDAHASGAERTRHGAGAGQLAAGR